MHFLFFYCLSTIVYCPLYYCHDKELSRWQHLKSHRFPLCATTHLTTKLCSWSAYTYKDDGTNESANPDTVRQLFERRICLCTVSSLTRRCCRTSTLVLYNDSIWKTWLGHGIFKTVFIFVDQESQQKWNPFMLEIGYQSGAKKMKSELFLFLFVLVWYAAVGPVCWGEGVW
jgi:hypothetical protein